MAASRWEGDPSRHGGEGGGDRPWTLLSWAQESSPSAALKGPSSRRHPRQSHRAPAPKHRPLNLSRGVTDALTPGGMSELCCGHSRPP